MGIDYILEKIAFAGDSAAEKILAEAKQTAAEIVSKKAAEASSENEALVSRAEQEAISQINHVKSTVALESRKLFLAAKREVIEEVFAEAKVAFRKLPAEDYAVFLTKVARKVSDRGSLVFAQNDAGVSERVKELLKDNPNYKVLKQTVKTIDSGFILKYDNVQINCSVDSIVENMRSELEHIIVSKLFNQ